MTILQRIGKMQRRVNKLFETIIDRLAKRQLEQASRQYELQYDKPLSEQEIIEIKKGVVLRVGFFVCIPVVILLLTLMNGGV
ncbi:hypothetical protein [Paenisporosarcina sp. OV554]|uniref:hypothetical protein n=1 Tax=Paenisporosarcina sp. OV554 TaxID=2135694 RepID=UPI000D3C6656|nr:hypothetical protein [Paenisporosarcina sp. OV554]PUB09471.1 hypothetical protein C8K15_13023 [Paenisporosarcina sp. OV554]